MGFDFYSICKDCGKCCKEDYSAFVTEKEIEELKKLGYKDFYEGNHLKSVNGVCIFFKDKKCSIQENKPMGCQIFPVMYFFGAKSKKPYYFLDLQCPVAMQLPKEKIDNLIKKSNDFFNVMTKEEYTKYAKEQMKSMKDAFNFE